MIRIVKATRLHCREMAEILNELITDGSTTALTEAVTGNDIDKRINRLPQRSAWHVAEDEYGHVVGFQWIEPADYLPTNAAEIATFARMGKAGLGIGSALFEATKRTARELGYEWINANIRADNAGGLAYYQSRGFEDYGRKDGVRASDGRRFDKVLKRYDL